MERFKGFLLTLVIFSLHGSLGCKDEATTVSLECTADTECKSGELCIAGKCVSETTCDAAETLCGTSCCTSDETCNNGVCEPAPEQCNAPKTRCGTDCCSETQECIGGACVDRCETVRCGDTQTCCGSGESCLTSGICCGANKGCGDVCCGDGEICNAGACEVDCGGTPPCGPSQACCGNGEICYLDECITLGNRCINSGCATIATENTCPNGEFCDPVLGRCLPIRADAECTYEPPKGVFDPVPLFSWGQRRLRNCSADSDCQKAEICQTSTCTPSWNHVTPAADDLPEYYQVSSIPMVADLDLDCVPEIVFNTYADSAFTRDGVLRAIRGDDGAKVWTVTDQAYRTNATANPAIGDLDGDGQAEIIVQGIGAVLLAFDWDGTPLWTSANFGGTANSGSPSIVNLDTSGDAEIVFGRAVLDSSGNIIFTGNQGQGSGGQGPISCIADLDGDGRQELIGGNTAYAFTGTVADNTFSGSVRWNNGNIRDGFCGIADFNQDGAPEVVLVSNGSIYVLQGQTGDVLASYLIPGAGHGGAPNIADFDGDGIPDIGTAGASNYVLVRFNGVDAITPIWEAPTEDDSSSRTGSSVFDFDGDGQNEVVYNDEEYVRIYPGVEPGCLANPPTPDCDGIMTDDEILFRDLNSSRTRTEYPVIADVDGDFKAEIVFGTSNEAGFLAPELLGDAGIEVWKDRLDNWVSTRPIWNQHTYHITNVGLAGEIPDNEAPNWSTPENNPYNSYRRNTQGANNFCAPDLIISGLRVTKNCPSLTATFWVVNQGCLGVGSGVKLNVIDENFGVVGSAQTTGALIAGGAEEMSVPLSGYPVNFDYNVKVTVDDAPGPNGDFNECREDNNESLAAIGRCQIDL